MPDLARQIYVTRALHEVAGARLVGLFTEVVVLEEAQHAHRPRFEAALQTSLDEAILLDGDTLFLAPVYELFDLLEHFDVALAAAPQYLSPMGMRLGIYDLLPKIPAAIAEWNGGLMVARLDEPFRTMVTQWIALYAKCAAVGYEMDQAALRAALVLSKLSIATVQNNFNFRALVPQSVAGQVKILHAHGELKKIARTINASTAMRLYTPRPEDIHGFHPK